MIKPALRQNSELYLPLMSGLLVCLGLAACTPPSADPQLPMTSRLPTSLPPAFSPVATFTNKPVPDHPMLPPTASPTPGESLVLCSPFPGASQADLLGSISNPFNPPPPGSDDPHQGVDLAVQQDGLALAGDPVQAVLSGRVAMVTEDRFPYGYSLLVETPFEALPSEWMRRLQLPTPASTRAPDPALTCPAIPLEPSWDREKRSLYTLYAHLAERAAFQPGDNIQCGQTIGRIGQSGNALNPHLHLEVRFGPAGTSFSSMAHYDNTVTPEEMGNYCLWRVSDLFQLVDPLRLLAGLP